METTAAPKLAPHAKPVLKPSVTPLPPPPSFGKTPAAAPMELNFEDNKEKAPFVALDILALLAAASFAVLLVLVLLKFNGN